MEDIKRGRLLPWPIPVAVALLSALPGCGDDRSDFDKAKSGAPLKTPSEVRREAEAQYGTPKNPADQAATPKGSSK